MSTWGGGSRGRARGLALAPLLLGASLLVLPGCAPSPEDAATGELTGVVVSRNDHPLPFGGGTVDSWSRALVLTRDELLAAFEASWPGRDDPADHEIASIVIKVDVAEVRPEDMAEVDGGRFRLSWSEAGRYVCLGNDQRGVVTTAGCVLVDVDAPAAITIESSIGGFSVES
ncbi:hypothetical protein [Nocardioides astragali]|uniref:Uncharacterized protein n=1 Tax=Nocardioides astragali TaxID=1776736 RepID=A0ABW2N5X4_9ACTN|nr:hypothetical protein [Nocardioides astragali]